MLTWGGVLYYSESSLELNQAQRGGHLYDYLIMLPTYRNLSRDGLVCTRSTIPIP